MLSTLQSDYILIARLMTKMIRQLRLPLFRYAKDMFTTLAFVSGLDVTRARPDIEDILRPTSDYPLQIGRSFPF